ncbi:MAG: TolC family protein [Cyclobacteriaceae bacterium]|nr:TolC family protein [Cyclobacteriaceae bacterium]
MKKSNVKQMRKGEAVLAVLLFFIFHSSCGQTDLRTLLDISEKNYPAITAKQALAEAARGEISLEKNTLIPSLAAAYETNYATYNNITGMSYPGTVIPISGPPSTENSDDPVPGSAASLMLRWIPVTFGQRSASIAYFQKLYEKQLSEIEDISLRVKFRVILTYLEIAATRELIKAYQKNIERYVFNLSQVNSLVSAGIRPAVDNLQFKGELSRARTELIKLENLLETQMEELRELVGSEELKDIRISGFFFQNLPVKPVNHDPADQNVPDSMVNPVLKMAWFDVEANYARLKQINRSWTPRVTLWGTTYARGSGISYKGEVNKLDGWSFSRYNYGVGIQVVMPILGIAHIKLKSRQQEALIQNSESIFKNTRLALNKQENLALNDLVSSLRIADEVPVEYEASESAYYALQSRYNAGLIDYAELIRAQYDLLNAEAGLKNAYVSSWKGLLKLAVIRGDIDIFLDQAE